MLHISFSACVTKQQDFSLSVPLWTDWQWRRLTERTLTKSFLLPPGRVTCQSYTTLKQLPSVHKKREKYDHSCLNHCHYMEPLSNCPESTRLRNESVIMLEYEIYTKYMIINDNETQQPFKFNKMLNSTGPYKSNFSTIWVFALLAMIILANRVIYPSFSTYNWLWRRAF